MWHHQGSWVKLSLTHLADTEGRPRSALGHWGGWWAETGVSRPSSGAWGVNWAQKELGGKWRESILAEGAACGNADRRELGASRETRTVQQEGRGGAGVAHGGGPWDLADHPEVMVLAQAAMTKDCRLRAAHGLEVGSWGGRVDLPCNIEKPTRWIGNRRAKGYSVGGGGRHVMGEGHYHY